MGVSPSQTGDGGGKLRIGLVGLGSAWEKRHRAALRNLADRMEVRAVYDQVVERAQIAASEWGARAVDSFRVLAGSEDIDAILLLCWQWGGVLPVLAACGYRKAVYLGAGLPESPEEARRIHQRVQESQVPFMAGFPRRHSPATLRLKELIATRLGRPELLFCHRRLPLEEVGERGGGGREVSTATWELVELVDWCCFVVGRRPRWVTGTVYRAGPGACGKDYRVMSLDFSEGPHWGEGPVAQISCGRYIPGRWREAISYRPLAALQVSCERGIAFVDLPSTLIWFDEAGRHQESVESDRPVGEQLLMCFCRLAAGSDSGRGNLQEAYGSLWIVEQARRSSQQGRRLAV